MLDVRNVLQVMLISSAMALAANLPASSGDEPSPEATDLETLRAQVEATERAFAQTMADRDFDAFVNFVAEDAVFFSGPDPIQGRDAIAADWKRYYEGPEAPFSWEPTTVVVLESGTLAHSSGPVRNSAGVHVGDFNSIWRREPSGEWKNVFDKGSPVCPQSAPPTED